MNHVAGYGTGSICNLQFENDSDSSLVSCQSNRKSCQVQLQTHLDFFDFPLSLADEAEVVSGSDAGERRPPEEFSSTSDPKYELT